MKNLKMFVKPCKRVMARGGNVPIVVTYDARGNGNGDIACTITGNHQDRITDYTAIVVEKRNLTE